MSNPNNQSGLRNPSDGEQYDHEIRLVDAASPTGSAADPASPTRDQAPGRRSRDSSAERKWSKTGLREELARRKYARFQEERYAGDNNEGAESSEAKSGIQGSSTAGSGSVVDRGRARAGRLRDKLRAKKQARTTSKEEAAIDVLYENQRGLFLCGIPYYSSNSLLNFDPAAWTSADFQDSPVDVTNAQVPSPLWVWAWPSWYVDMAHDVDEEGWTYSFSFRQGFAWHGTHPWFYSWVRRRRWLRKRVRVHSAAHDHLLADSMTEAHQLNPDYFTIHSGRRERSPDSNVERDDKRSSFFSGSRAVADTDSEPEEEISNVIALVNAMRATTVDRKKLDAVQNFLENGESEVFYLPDIIQEVMAMFVYQHSRRQLLQMLERARQSAVELATGASPGEKGPRSRSKRRDGLQKAIDAVTESVSNLEYWSDVKMAEKQPTSSAATDLVEEMPLTSKHDPAETPAEGKDMDLNEEISNVTMRGIPAGAELDVEPGIMRPLGFMQEGLEAEHAPSAKEKGKQKA